MSTRIADELQRDYPHMKYVNRMRGEPPPPPDYESEIERTQGEIDRLELNDFETLLDENINKYGFKDEVECMAEACLERDAKMPNNTNRIQILIYSTIFIVLIGCLILYLFRLREEHATLSCAKKRRTLLSTSDEPAKN